MGRAPARRAAPVAAATEAGPAQATPPSAPDDARTRLLRSAVALFAERGVAQVSLRELTQRACVNVAAVNYYYGSRVALEEAVFDEVAQRLNAGRLGQLDEVLALADAAGMRPAIEDVVEAFARPYLDPDTAAEGALLAQLILQHRLAPTEMTRRVIRRHFDPMAERFIAAMQQACPLDDPQEHVWRYMFMTSTVVLIQTDRQIGNRVAHLSGGALDARDPAALKKSLLRYVVGGLRVASSS